MGSFSWTQKCRFYVKMNGQYPQYVGDRQFMVAGQPQTAKKAAKRSPTELEQGEIKRQRRDEAEDEEEEEEDFDSEEDEDFEDEYESDEEDYSEYAQGIVMKSGNKS